MTKTIYFIPLLIWQLQAQANEVVLFQDPPTTKEILESFGEPVVKTRGDKKTRKLVSKNLLTEPEKTYSDANGIKGGDVGTEHKVEILPSNVRINKPHTVPVAFALTFPAGSAELSNEASKYIDSMADALKKKPDLSIRISGHTDIIGGDEVNIPLSLKRAETVQNYLKEKHQIELSRLEISGEGSMFPFDSINPTSSLNRRVQFERIYTEK